MEFLKSRLGIDGPAGIKRPSRLSLDPALKLTQDVAALNPGLDSVAFQAPCTSGCIQCLKR